METYYSRKQRDKNRVICFCFLSFSSLLYRVGRMMRLEWETADISLHHTGWAGPGSCLCVSTLPVWTHQNEHRWGLWLFGLCVVLHTQEDTHKPAWWGLNVRVWMADERTQHQNSCSLSFFLSHPHSLFLFPGLVRITCSTERGEWDRPVPWFGEQRKYSFIITSRY